MYIQLFPGVDLANIPGIDLNDPNPTMREMLEKLDDDNELDTTVFYHELTEREDLDFFSISFADLETRLEIRLQDYAFIQKDEESEEDYLYL